MIKWSDLVNLVLEKYQEIYFRCARCTDVERSISSLPRDVPPDIHVLDPCIACIITEILEGMHGVPRIYISSALGDATLYVLKDALLELGEEGGTLASITMMEEFVEFLSSLGFEIDKEVIKNLVEQIARA